jgi:L-Lysine epsilon oxidase N-terminal/L-lysine epsilon oxidase C-terminal domain
MDSNEKSPEIDRDSIVRAAIYPAIGVCRIGNSAEYFIAPEVTHRDPQPASFYRDSTGKLKRQAARFRVYGLNALGEPVRELTTDEAEIKWQVKLANQKSAWYQFQLAMDIPEAKDAPPSCLRNATVSDRKKLIIDHDPISICGKNLKSEPFMGAFMDTDVYLGELHTDESGRLIVLGGLGKSASYNGSKAVTFANNEGWHDDTSDGPVTATVMLNKIPLEVEPAWVITAPPDYAPDQKSVRTMWDLMRDTGIKAGLIKPAPTQPSFMHDILPIFERMTKLQWVNAGFAAGFGHGGLFNYTTPEWIAKLSNPSPAFLEVRKVLVDHFRNYKKNDTSPLLFPWLYGDAMDVPSSNSPRQNATLSDTQLMFLQQWAEGTFIDDYDPYYKHPQDISEVPVAQQPDMLIKASMEYCLADAFHPGCEMTWPMRNRRMYESPFRLKHAPDGWIPPPLSAYLDPGSVNDLLAVGQMAGDITRWMAVPWQTDTASCRSGYDKKYDPYLPTFWPARVPNQVLSEKEYQIVMDTTKNLGERLQAFARRTDWNEPLGDDALNKMVSDFDEMGIVEMRKGVDNDPLFPTQIGVQVLKPKDGTVLDEADTAVKVTNQKESNTIRTAVHFRLSHGYVNEGE